MRLKRLAISDFKNLRKFSMTFDAESAMDVIIGKNGSGKSNLVEAIIEIFRHLSDPETPISFSFQIEYESNTETVLVEGKDGKLLLNGAEIKKLSEKHLPDNILIYYSGHNDRVSALVRAYEESYRRRIRGAELKELRRFFGLTNEHKAILLMILMLLDDESAIKKQAMSRLSTASIASEIQIILTKPYFFERKLETWDANPFWDTKGYLSGFLAKLASLSTKSSATRDEGYFAETERFIFYVPVNKMKELVAEESPIKVFQYFDDLRLIGMLGSVEFLIALQNGEKIKLRDFSDGEYQAIFLNGVLELFKDRSSIAVLDEPDAFLHPEWQFDLIRQMLDHAAQTKHKNHILLNSHCASTLVSAQDKRISLLQVQAGGVRCIAVSKEYAINQLSAGLISLNEEKQVLSILSSIKIANRPVLFTEGPTDTRIIEMAWCRIRTEPIPFLVLHGFSRGYLRQLLQDPKIYEEAGAKPIFGLFDFDDAYNDWNSIAGQEEELDPYKSMRKKIKDRNGFAYLLPIPQNPKLLAQVIKDPATKETYKENSRITIEHLFHGHAETAEFFSEETAVGGGKFVQFIGGKDHFANNIVPKLPADVFKTFVPLFDSLVSKIT